MKRAATGVSVGAALFSVFSLICIAGAANAAEPSARFQVSGWFSYMEDPFINYFHTSTAPFINQKSAANGLSLDKVDPETGLPLVAADGDVWVGNLLSGSGKDGAWVFEWECEGGGAFCADFAIWAGGPSAPKSPGRMEFVRDFSKNEWLGFRIHLKRLDGKLKRIALFRKEDEAAYRAGRIYRPSYCAAVKPYDIVRTMDYQMTNSARAVAVDEIATMKAAFWNLTDQDGRKYDPPYMSMPLEGVIALGVECGTEVWMHAPIGLGFPEVMRKAKVPEGVKFHDFIAPHTDAIFASDEWEKYADALVAALKAQNYPEDRPLYLTIGNEVWNWGANFYYGTAYGNGVGAGLNYRTAGDKTSIGYGALMAKLKISVDAALARAGRKQNITYVVERMQGANPAIGSLNGAKTWLGQHGEDWADHAPGFALAYAPYWKVEWEEFAKPDEWRKMIAEKPEETAKAFADFNIASFRKKEFVWAEELEKQAAEPFGVRVLGMYEAGNHLKKLPAFIDKQWRDDFIWGPEGGRANYEIYRMMAERFPGIVISNYALAGPVGGEPWGEGPLGADNAYARSWPRLMEAVGHE